MLHQQYQIDKIQNRTAIYPNWDKFALSTLIPTVHSAETLERDAKLFLSRRSDISHQDK